MTLFQAVLAGGVFAGVAKASHHYSLALANDAGHPLYVPPELTSVVLAAYNEEKYIPRALNSLLNQNVIQAMPDRFELIMADSHSTDQTAKIAEASGFKVVEAGKGKLTARDAAMRAATGDVVFTADADTYYPPNVVNLMLRHFQAPTDIVAVFSPRLHEGFPDEYTTALLNQLTPFYRMAGSNSALRRQAYFDIGGFDLTVDQTDVNAIQIEEEKQFIYRLAKVGEVFFERRAGVLTSMRRFSRSDKDYIGEVARGERF